MFSRSDERCDDVAETAPTVGKPARRLREIVPAEAEWWATVTAYGPAHPSLISTAEVAEAVGRSPTTVRWWRWRGQFPAAVIVGGRLRHLRREVQGWMLTRRRSTVSLVAARAPGQRARPGR